MIPLEAYLRKLKNNYSLCPILCDIVWLGKDVKKDFELCGQKQAIDICVAVDNLKKYKMGS